MSAPGGKPSAPVFVKRTALVESTVGEASIVKPPAAPARAPRVNRRSVESFVLRTPSPTHLNVVLVPRIRLAASLEAAPIVLATPALASLVTCKVPADHVNGPVKVLAALSSWMPPVPPSSTSAPEPEMTPLTTKALAAAPLVHVWLEPITKPTLAPSVVTPAVNSKAIPAEPSVIVCAEAALSVKAALRKTSPSMAGFVASVTVPPVPAK